MTKPNWRTGPRTTAIHAGEAPDPVTGASAPNLVMSTTYVLDRPLGFSAQDLGDDSPFIYTRWGNPTVRQLEDKLAALEGAESCLCFASGMAASAAVLLGSLSAGDPILRLSDIAALAALTQKAGARLAVDSTFATPVATRPLDLGADFIVHALTKYVGGHGDALGGAVLGAKAELDALHLEATIHHGGTLSPFNAWLILRGAATLPLRMAAHEAGALEVARFLEDHPKVAKVLYPGLPSHPQHDLAKRQMANFSGMIAFQPKSDGKALAARMAEDLEILHYAVSLGHHRSLIYWIGTDDLMASSFALEGAQLASYRAFAGDGVFRLSVGLEDAQDLCRDLDQVLSAG